MVPSKVHVCHLRLAELDERCHDRCSDCFGGVVGLDQVEEEEEGKGKERRRRRRRRFGCLEDRHHISFFLGGPWNVLLVSTDKQISLWFRGSISADRCNRPAGSVQPLFAE